MRRLAAAMLALLMASGPVLAERLVSVLSNDRVAITSSFDGERLTFAGTIEPDVGLEPLPPGTPYDVVIVITGPRLDRVARRKTNNFGIWINTDAVRFERFPTYFHVLSTRRLTDITDVATLNVNGMLAAAQAQQSAQTDWWNADVYGRQLVRLMEERGMFGVNEQAVHMETGRFYTARLELPTDVPNGLFLAQTYVFQDGRIVAKRADGFSVQKTGFERFVGAAARDYPLLYGLFAVALALFTGWLGGVVFKR